MNSWADYGFPDKIYLSPPLPILNGLAAALKERNSILGRSSIIAPLPLSPFNYVMMKTWFACFENALNQTIPGFVNHTVNDGDFTGLDAIPFWTSEDIYEYLDEDELKYADCILSPLLWSKYLLQKYRVINMLRWTIAPYHASISNGVCYYCTSLTAAGASSINGAVDNAIAKAIELGPKESNSFAISDVQIGWSSYDEKYYSNCHTAQSDISYNNIQSLLPFAYDFYLFVGSNFPKNVTIFDGVGIVSSYGLTLFSSGSEMPYENIDIGTVGSAPGPWPVYPTNETRHRGWMLEYVLLISKFDGPNGFNFRGEDW